MGVEDSEKRWGSICSDQPSARRQDEKKEKERNVQHLTENAHKPEYRKKKKAPPFRFPANFWPIEGSPP